MSVVGDILMVTNLNMSLSSRELKNKKFLEVVLPISDSLRIVGGGVPDEYENKIDVSTIRRPMDNRSWFFIRVVRHLIVQILLANEMVKHRDEYDTILLFMGYSAPACVGRLLGKRIVRYHGGPSLEHSKLTNLFMNTIPNIFCHRILVPSKGCVQHFGIERYEEKIGFFHFHIDSRFKINTHINERETYIGYLGHLTENKGVDIVLEAAELINDRMDRTVYLELAGTGPLENQIDFDRDFIRYHGWADREEAVDLYNKIKIFLLPSKSEGLPTVLMESMACGTPVIASDIGGIPDLVNDNVNGRVLEQRDPESLADEVCELIHSDKLTLMHFEAFNTINQEYRLTEVQTQLERELSGGIE